MAEWGRGLRKGSDVVGLLGAKHRAQGADCRAQAEVLAQHLGIYPVICDSMAAEHRGQPLHENVPAMELMHWAAAECGQCARTCANSCYMSSAEQCSLGSLRTAE